MISISCPVFATTYGLSSHPTQFHPDPSQAAPQSAPENSLHSSRGGTIGANIGTVARETLSIDTGRCAESIYHPQEQLHVREPEPFFNTSSDEKDLLHLSPSMSSLFTESRSGSPTSSITLHFSSDDDDDDFFRPGISGGSPVTFAVRDLDEEDLDDDIWNGTDVVERSPLTFARPDIERDDDDLETVYYRRVSWPMIAPSTSSISVGDVGEEKKDGKMSSKALKRQSRSMDKLNLLDLPTVVDGPNVGLLAETDWGMLESQAQGRHDPREESSTLNELDIQYILSVEDDDRRRTSDALSYVKQAPKIQDTGYLLSLRRRLTGTSRPPSSADASEEDTFATILEKWDSDYDARKDYWTIKRQDDVDSHVLTTVLGTGGFDGSLGRMSRGKAKVKDKQVGNKGMSPGTEEIWTCGFEGVFKAERVNYTAESRPPHQRLNLRRVPANDVNVEEGPSMVIHKHSRTIAFSIVRAYSFGKSERLGNGILLAPRKVQVRFTATKNTSKLVTHGLLGDDKDKGKSRGVEKEVTESFTESQFSGEFIIFNDSVDNVHFSATGGTDAGPSSRPLFVPAIASQTQTSISFESTSDNSTIRSLHAYGRPPLHRRNSSDYSPSSHDPHMTKTDSLSSSFFKRWLRPPPPNQKSVAPSGDFKAPWITMSPKSKQDETDRAIGRLNDSLMGVGLAPIKPVKPKRSFPKYSERPGILGHLSEDTLYMILPLWAGECHQQAARVKTSPSQTPALEDRCYLLVYYVPFAGKPKRQKKRPPPTSSAESGKSTRGRSILLSDFHVCACVVNYEEFRGSGVRLPSKGLLVSGPADEALHYPQKVSGINDPHGLVIGVYHGKERRVEFVPEGILKLGLCSEPQQNADSIYQPEEIEETRLSALGKAVVEMVWAGCMALSSFQ